MRTIEEMKTLFNAKGYNLLSTEYNGNKSPLVFEKDGYKYQNTYNGFIKTDNPKKWGKSNPFSLQNISHYLIQNSIPCKLLSNNFNYDDMEFECSCGNAFHINLSNFLIKKQYNCPKCGRLRSSEKHIDLSYLDYLESMNLIPITKYAGAKNPIYCKNSDGYILKIYPYNLRNGQKTIERIIFSQYNEYFVDNYKNFIKINEYECEFIDYISNKNHGDLKLKCSCGKEFKSNSQWFRKGIGICCPDCSLKRSSSYEKQATEWLKENRIDFIREKTFEGCKDKALLRFDYYIPSLNLCIEIDGEQHFRVAQFGGADLKEATKVFKTLKKHDSIKNDFCARNKIKLLRIPYTAFQKKSKTSYSEILNSHIFG